MKLLSSIPLCVVCGCLAGCTVTPTPAHKLFGTSNPTAIVSTPEGNFRMPTDMQARYIITKNPNGTSRFDLTLKSDPNGTIRAEGERIPGMLPGMEINHAWATAATQANHQTADKALDRGFGLIETLAPLLIKANQPAGTEPEAPPDQLDALKLEIKNMLEADRGNLLIQVQAMIEANKKKDEDAPEEPEPAGPVP